jgi:hypothetical protein
VAANAVIVLVHGHGQPVPLPPLSLIRFTCARQRLTEEHQLAIEFNDPGSLFSILVRLRHQR